jgi:hypothetical protein
MNFRSKPWRRRLRENLMMWIIFLPLMLIGVGLLGLAVLKVTQHLAAQSWQPVQATLLERSVAVEKNSAHGNKIGGAERLAGKFSYKWEGKSYESIRVSFFNAMTRTMGMAPDDWDKRVGDVLGEPGGTLTVWVNPHDPSEAVALRDLRWLEIGAMVGFGLMLVWIGWLFLFGGNPHTAKAAFSWCAVGVTWAIGLVLGVLVPLLWRDGHPVWAALTALPLILAICGTVNGLRLGE